VATTFKPETEVRYLFHFWSTYTYPLTVYSSLFNCCLPSLQCIVANLDANDEKNAALSKKYEIQGFPTLKFFPKGQSEPIEYEGGRSEEDLVKFLNEKCGAQRKVGGGLNEKVSWFCGLCLGIVLFLVGIQQEETLYECPQVMNRSIQFLSCASSIDISVSSCGQPLDFTFNRSSYPA
jgi:hypothetical protein